jgi:hypothetical protein
VIGRVYNGIRFSHRNVAASLHHDNYNLSSHLMLCSKGLHRDTGLGSAGSRYLGTIETIERRERCQPDSEWGGVGLHTCGPILVRSSSSSRCCAREPKKKKRERRKEASPAATATMDGMEGMKRSVTWPSVGAREPGVTTHMR